MTIQNISQEYKTSTSRQKITRNYKRAQRKTPYQNQFRQNIRITKQIHRERLKEKHRTRKYHVLYHTSYSPTTSEAALPHIAGFQQAKARTHRAGHMYAIANAPILTHHKKIHHISFQPNVMKITQSQKCNRTPKIIDSSSENAPHIITIKCHENDARSQRGNR